MKDHEIIECLNREFTHLFERCCHHVDGCYTPLNNNLICLYRTAKPGVKEFELRYEDDFIVFQIRNGRIEYVTKERKEKLISCLQQLIRSKALVPLE